MQKVHLHFYWLEIYILSNQIELSRKRLVLRYCLHERMRRVFHQVAIQTRGRLIKHPKLALTARN